MNWKILLSFLIGAGSGAACGYFVARKQEEVYWKQRLDEEVGSYQRLLDQYNERLILAQEKTAEAKKMINKIYGIQNEEKADSQNASTSSYTPHTEVLEGNSDESVEEAVERARKAAERNHILQKQYEHYGDMYEKQDNWEALPSDPEESESSYEENGAEDILAEEEKRDQALQYGEGCIVVTPEEISDLPGYIETTVLLYYEDSDILTEEDGTLIDNAELLIGDCIEQSGFREIKNDHLMVWNPEHRTVYEITKVPISYSEEEEY